MGLLVQIHQMEECFQARRLVLLIQRVVERRESLHQRVEHLRISSYVHRFLPLQKNKL